jgi:parallel beta-helix repeat protein
VVRGLIHEIHFTSRFEGIHETDPFPSIEAALKRAGGGNTFIFKPGYYVGHEIKLSPEHAGKPERPTILKSQYKYKAKLHGSLRHNIYIERGCKWVIIDGFESSGGRATGVMSNADYTVIRNCHIHNNSLLGMKVHEVEGTVIENNIVEYNGQHLQFDHGIYADGNNLTIRNNIVRFNSGWGLHLYPKIANSRIENNLVYGNCRWGIWLDSKGGPGSNRIVNNTVVQNGAGIVVKNGKDEIIANNIIVNNINFRFKTGPPIESRAGNKLSKFTVDYNLCIPEFAGAGPHRLSADPLFLDPMKGAFYLKKGSPAIGRGSKKFAPTRDFFNRPRPVDKAPDLGCFPYEPPLLSAEARQSWYYEWPFLFLDHSETIPDLWKLPPTEAEQVEGKE